MSEGRHTIAKVYSYMSHITRMNHSKIVTIPVCFIKARVLHSGSSFLVQFIQSCELLQVPGLIERFLEHLIPLGFVRCDNLLPPGRAKDQVLHRESTLAKGLTYGLAASRTLIVRRSDDRDVPELCQEPTQLMRNHTQYSTL